MSTLNEIYERLGSIDSKLDTLLKSDAEQTKEIKQLQRWKAYVVGITVGASYICNIIFKQHNS